MSGGEVDTPKLRFPEFSGEWEYRELQWYAEENGLKTGPFGSQLKASEYVSGNNGIPVVMPKDIRSGEISDDTISRVSFEKAKEMRRHQLELNDVLFPRRGELGRIALTAAAQVGWLCGTGCLRMRPNQKVWPGFLVAALQQERSIQWLKDNAVGQTMLNLNTDIVGRLPICAPDLPEQQKIAAFVGAVDQKIMQLTRKKALLEDYKKGCMQKLFSRQTRFKDDQGNDFPSWEETTFGSLFTWVGTNNLSRDKLNYDSNGQVQNIHYGDIHSKFHANFRQSAEEVPFISNSNRDDFEDADFCQLGDLVIADASEDYADIGKSIEIMSLSDVPIVAGLHTYIARPRPNKLKLGFAGYLLRSRDIRLQIIRAAQGISVLGISKGNLEKIKLRLPQLAEQRKIGIFLTAIDEKTQIVSRQLEKAQSYKLGLLQKIFV